MSTEGLFIRELELDHGSKLLRINQHSVGDVGHVVWDAGIALAKYLDIASFRRGPFLKNKTVVELGSGTGIVGLCAAALGANVTLTDLPELMILLERNIQDNKDILDGVVRAMPWRWGEPFDHATPDFMLIADCIYYEESVNDLAQSVLELSGPTTEVFLSYEERKNKDQLVHQFLMALREKFIAVNIPYDEQHPEFRSWDINLLRLHVS